jgi:hypothetical protein
LPVRRDLERRAALRRLLLRSEVVATDALERMLLERNGISPLDLHDEVVHIECHLYMCHY